MTLTVRSATVAGATTKGSPLTHAELDANFAHVIESSNHNFAQSGTGASSRDMQTKVREIQISVKDFGAVGDGVTLDDTAIDNAYAATPAGGTLVFPRATSGYLISTKKTIAKKIKILFEGGAAVASGDYPGAYLRKKSTMAATALEITANGVVVEHGGVLGEGGNTGNGIDILANNVSLIRTGVFEVGGDGIRIGADAGVNANSFYLEKPVSSENTGHGIYIHDNSGGAPDANAGVIVLPLCQSNDGDGIRIGNARFNTLLGPLCEVNTGAGIHFTADSHTNVVLGGDTNEGNGTTITITSGAINTQIFGGAHGTIVDGSITTIRPNDTGDWTPVIVGASSAGTGTYSQQLGWYSLIGNVVHFGGVLVWSAHTGTGNMTITGLPYATPNVAGRFGTCHFDVNSLTGASPPTTVVSGRIGTNSAIIAVNQYAAGTGGAVDMANVQTGNIVFTGTYRVN